ncbi:cytochrome P450 [Caulobacter vibrioides]|uniref:Cytochrome P450 n=1 Tax=Caulobacter vibrioides (strain NA1000 / CB15N) TaxID=565050 RepID=A0A0H3CA52_CAUVN|nr:cytochrome P450 [Caulobacter vibrioides]YP_002517952.1 cytochrome P450 [Caulobacter vibrioides NA1000]ACL96044.1 cytochrome P450 [Caulobacter vibrioides NA1000]ATC29346.1 cytochrome P450 [Caulobacter vibrioides]QXZ50860.1 cytochrome P450 [Caulobacter vibrioides]
MTISTDIANTIIDPKAYADGDRIDQAFAHLRREAPLAVAQPDGFDPFWVVTRHADILEVERQNELFHNGDRATVVTTIEADKKVREMMGGSPHLVRSLVQMDNPDHFAYRKITQGALLPQNLRALEARIREIARGFVDRMAEHGDRCDFARDVAFLYPLHVIMEVLGVPESDEPRMLKLTQELFGNADPDLNRTGKSVTDVGEGVDSIQSVVMDFMMYFNAITEDRRANPRDDLATLIANGKINGEPMGHLEAMSYYIIAATAGHDTTSSTTAGALWALAENPDQFAKVKADPSLIPGLIEESIRWVTPVKHFMRTATADAELGGQKIAKGDWIMLSYPSGNRDEAVFEDPFTFRVDRTPNKHVAFGYGAHICLGQHLARMEMRVLWEELFARLDHVELDGAPTRMVANFVCGPKSVPIRFKMH